MAHLTTQVNIPGDTFIDDDFAFATRDGLVLNIRHDVDPAGYESLGITTPCERAKFDFKMQKAVAADDTDPRTRMAKALNSNRPRRDSGPVSMAHERRFRILRTGVFRYLVSLSARLPHAAGARWSARPRAQRRWHLALHGRGRYGWPGPKCWRRDHPPPVLPKTGAAIEIRPLLEFLVTRHQPCSRAPRGSRASVRQVGQRVAGAGSELARAQAGFGIGIGQAGQQQPPIEVQ